MKYWCTFWSNIIFGLFVYCFYLIGSDLDSCCLWKNIDFFFLYLFLVHEIFNANTEICFFRFHLRFGFAFRAINHKVKGRFFLFYPCYKWFLLDLSFSSIIKSWWNKIELIKFFFDISFIISYYSFKIFDIFSSLWKSYFAFRGFLFFIYFFFKILRFKDRRFQ